MKAASDSYVKEAIPGGGQNGQSDPTGGTICMHEWCEGWTGQDSEGRTTGAIKT